MPLVQRLAGTEFWSLYRQGARHRQLDDAQRATVQRQLTQRLLAHAAENVPLWRERLVEQRPLKLSAEEVCLAAEFGALPITTKADLRSGFPERVTSAGSREYWRYGSSAGTVDRVTIVSDFAKRDQLRAINLQIVDSLIGNPLGARIVEVPPDACNVVCALRDEGPLELRPYVLWALKKRILFKRETRPDLRGRLERSFIIRQDTLEPFPAKSYPALVELLDAHLERMLAARANILRGLPLFLLWLAERAAERRLKFPSLLAILPYGGLMSGAIASRVSAAFDAPFFDYYGTSEIGPIALQHAGERGMRVFDDQVLVEIVDAQNKPLPAGHVGKILVTDYHNSAMPIIRYEIGDYGRWLSDDTDSCDPFQLCRTARLEIVGRAVEMTTLTSGQLLSARDVMDVVFRDEAVLNACVEGKSQRPWSLKVVARNEIRNSTVETLQELLEADGPIKLRAVDYLRPEASGKYQVFKP